LFSIRLLLLATVWALVAARLQLTTVPSSATSSPTLPTTRSTAPASSPPCSTATTKASTTATPRRQQGFCVSEKEEGFSCYDLIFLMTCTTLKLKSEFESVINIVISKLPPFKVVVSTELSKSCSRQFIAVNTSPKIILKYLNLQAQAFFFTKLPKHENTKPASNYLFLNCYPLPDFCSSEKNYHYSDSLDDVVNNCCS